MYAYPEENAQSVEGPSVGFDYETVFGNLDTGGREDSSVSMSGSSGAEAHADGLRRVLDWILTEEA